MKKFLLHLFVPHESNNQRAKLIHPSGLSVVIGLYVLFQVGLGWISNRYPNVLGYAAFIKPEEVVRLTNIEREANGLGTVSLDPKLSEAAAQKAADMVARDYWAHVSPIGTQPWSFVTGAGYSYRYAGENLARDFSDATSVVKAWMASPSHRENLLNPRYQDIGIAVIDGKLGGHETTLVVQIFGSKLSATGVVGSAATALVAKAAESSNENVKTPIFNRFDLTKFISLILLVIFATVLLVDIVVVFKQGIIRWTSKSFAHLAFVVMLIIALLVINRGMIL